MPEPLFDTMLADQVLHNRGYGRKLQDLAKEYLGLDLSKGLQKSDWSGNLSSEQIQYAANDALAGALLYPKLTTEAETLGMSQILDQENRALPTVVWMENKGVAMDKPKWDALVGRQRTEAAEVREELDLLLGGALQESGNPAQTVNWDSPRQVLEVLRTLDLDVQDTKNATLQKVQHRHPVVPRLIRYRAAQARTKTFNEQWAKPHAITNRVHADWRLIGAATGRMACQGPNLQNIPRDAETRSCFVAAPGHVLIKADFSQIELRIVAEIAQDPALIECFSQGLDVHRLTAMRVTGKQTPEEVTDEERQLAKALNFGLIYGMGHRLLAATVTTKFGIELSEDEAEILKTRFFQAYRGLREWQRRQGNATDSRTILGRRRVFEADSYYTERLNSPVQGSAADGLKLALPTN